MMVASPSSALRARAATMDGPRLAAREERAREAGDGREGAWRAPLRCVRAATMSRSQAIGAVLRRCADVGPWSLGVDGAARARTEGPTKPTRSTRAERLAEPSAARGPAFVLLRPARLYRWTAEKAPADSEARRVDRTLPAQGATRVARGARMAKGERAVARDVRPGLTLVLEVVVVEVLLDGIAVCVDDGIAVDDPSRVAVPPSMRRPRRGRRRGPDSARGFGRPLVARAPRAPRAPRDGACARPRRNRRPRANERHDGEHEELQAPKQRGQARLRAASRRHAGRSTIVQRAA